MPYGHAINNFEILNINILISLCSCEIKMLMLSISKLFMVSKASSSFLSRWTGGGRRGGKLGRIMLKPDNARGFDLFFF